jgi:hypothetical protein
MAEVTFTKICVACNRNLSVDQFEINQGYLRRKCRDCRHLNRYGVERRRKSQYRAVEIDGVLFKRCSRCLETFEQSEDNFYRYKRGCFHAYCKPCSKQSVKESRAKDERFNEKVAARRSRWTAERRASHRVSVSNYQKKARRDNPQFRLVHTLRNKLSKVMRGRVKNSGLLRLLGFSRGELLAHLERQFLPGMSWDNYGSRLGADGWEIDHIIPCHTFDLSDDEQIKLCWALSNLRPLWAIANRRKQGRLNYLV